MNRMSVQTKEDPDVFVARSSVDNANESRENPWDLG